MKGIILAGGSGTRLYPLTKIVSKQLMPIYDKPMIYYPLSVLMLAKIRDILIITTEEDQPTYKTLLNDGSQIGLNIEYKIQHSPNGIAEAFLLGEDFIGNSKCCLILGDNIFYNNRLAHILQEAQFNDGATIFGYPVRDPERFGIVEFDNNNKILSIEEKPLHPKSNFAVLGLYFYDNSVVEKAKKVKPSQRGELEITSINQMYLEENKLNLINFKRGLAWFDTGTSASLLEASNFVKTIQSNTGLYVACIEEIAYQMGWKGKDNLIQTGSSLHNTDYGKYLLSIASE